MTYKNMKELIDSKYKNDKEYQFGEECSIYKTEVFEYRYYSDGHNEVIQLMDEKKTSNPSNPFILDENGNIIVFEIIKRLNPTINGKRLFKRVLIRPYHTGIKPSELGQGDKIIIEKWDSP